MIRIENNNSLINDNTEKFIYEFRNSESSIGKKIKFSYLSILRIKKKIPSLLYKKYIKKGPE